MTIDELNAGMAKLRLKCWNQKMVTICDIDHFDKFLTLFHAYFESNSESKGLVYFIYNQIKENTESFYEGKSRRYLACLYTSRADVKKAVFDIHGDLCLRCGTSKDISLDHIIPVCHGGENTIENLQPLCIYCNSRKSDKIIDYRKEVCNG